MSRMSRFGVEPSNPRRAPYSKVAALRCSVRPHVRILGGTHEGTHEIFRRGQCTIQWDGALAPPKNWRRPRGRPRNTWLTTIKNDLAPQNIGLFIAVQKAQDRQKWRDISHRATL